MSSDLRHAIAAGSQINLDPEGPQFSLSGSGAALNMVSQCRASQGSQLQRPVAQQPSGPSVIKAPQKGTGCTDGGARLPATGLCQDEATRLINAVGGFELTYDPARCTAAINETAIVDQFLLYSAMRCDGVTSKLDFAGGARFSSLEISASAMNGSSANGIPVVTIGGLHDNDAEATIFDYVADVMEPGVARGKCFLQSGRDYGYPNDSYVVNDQPYKPNAEQFELGARCGNGAILTMRTVFGAPLVATPGFSTLARTRLNLTRNHSRSLKKTQMAAGALFISFPDQWQGKNGVRKP